MVFYRPFVSYCIIWIDICGLIGVLFVYSGFHFCCCFLAKKQRNWRWVTGEVDLGGVRRGEV